MKSKSFILGLILVSLVLAGCDGDSSTNTNPFVGGEQGLAVSYRPLYPPEEVFDCGDDVFDVEVILNNQGEYDIKQGEAIVTLSGILPSDLGSSSAALEKSNEEEIKGKYLDENNKQFDGVNTPIEFNDLSYGKCLTANTELPLWANVCYLYETKAVAHVCILQNPRETGGICEVIGDKTSFVSSGPVQITEFTENLRGTDKITFSFTIEKKGSGKVHKESAEDCSKDRNNDNKVFVEIDTGFGGVDCRGLKDGSATSGYVELDELGKYVVTCDQTAETTTDFNHPINVKLRYKYSEDIPHNLKIKHIPGTE